MCKAKWLCALAAGVALLGTAAAPQAQAQFIGSIATRKVLDVPGFSINDGTLIQQYTWNGGSN